MKAFALLRDRRAAMLAEAAIALSLLATLSLGGVEVARYALLHQKMERVAAGVGDMVAQAETLTEAEIASIMAAAEHIGQPFEMKTDGRVVVSAVSASDGTPPVVIWQRAGGGGYGATSRLGTPGSVPALPAGFTVAAGDTVIVAETFYRYTPWVFADAIGPTEVYQSAFFRPRLGALQQIN